MAQSQVKTQVYGEAPNFLLQGVTFGGMIVFTLLLVDLDRLATDGLTEVIPLLGVFAFAGQRLIPELQRIFQGYTQFQYANESANTLAGVLAGRKDQEFQVSGFNLSSEHQEVKPKDTTIRFLDLSYKYPSAETDSLRNISLDIPVGSKVGIVGTTGAGKTTFVDVLLGLLTPTGGSIEIGDMTLGGSCSEWWLSQCSYLPQDVFLIDDTIKSNIIFGEDKREDEDKLRRVVDIANLEEFLAGRVNGIDSIVGENGIQLSGGQRQRIGLARALYKDSKVIILDEATSALDNETEKNVLDRLYANIDDVTVFMIAHRLTSIRNCDTILVFNEGALVGKGSWDDLNSYNSWFKRLVTEKYETE
jgi:ABC-type multidrug transport system fused ATPase/permease subunit